jgi:hypothetical protein
MSLIEGPISMIALVVAYFSSCAVGFYFLVMAKRKRLIERKEKFSKALVEGLKTDSILWRHYGVGKVEFGKPSFN